MKIILVGLFVLLILIASIIIIKDEFDLSLPFFASNGSACNIARISLEGELVQSDSNATTPENLYSYTVSDDVLRKIDEAENDNSIDGVVLEIESGGGSPVAGEEIANALKRSSKYNVALIKDNGASGAYFASTGAGYIYASKLSNVGSIGVTSSYTSNERSNAMKGITYNSLSIGKFKDTGNRDKPLTEEERMREMSDIKKIYDVFVAEVAENRHMKVKDVYKIADGSTYVGNDALKLGLIDAIGDMSDAKSYLSSAIGEDAVFCEEETN